MMARDRLLLVIMAVSWLVVGLVEPFTPSYGEFYNEASLPHAVVLAILLFSWCKAHAAAIGRTPPVGAPFLVALFSPIGVPYYFFRSFPWRPALGGVVKAVLFFVVCGLLNYGGQLVGIRLAA
jgi:hypothetical protein